MQKSVEKLKQLHLACVMAPTNAVHADALLSHLQTFSSLTTEGGETFASLAASDFVPELVAIFSSPTSPSMVISECFKLLVDFTDPSSYEVEQERKLALQLINRILDCDLPQVSAAHETFAQGMEFYENLCEIYPSAGPDHLAERTVLLDRLTELLLGDNEDAELLLAASELLSIVINASLVARSSFKADKLLPVFTKLQSTNIAAALRVEEEEMFENLCAVISRIVLNSPQRKLEYGGRVLQEAFACIKTSNSVFAKRLGFKLVASVCKNSFENCSLFVDMGGLKFVFVFQRSQVQSAPAKRMRELGDNSTTSSALSVLSSLCLNLRDVHLQRVLAKLREQGKMDILLQLHCDYASRVAAKVDELDKEEDYDSEEEYMELAESGLQELEHIDIILASMWSSTTTAAAAASSKEIAEQVRKVVADCAERELLLDDDTGAVLEANTIELKAKLVNLALFQ